MLADTQRRTLASQAARFALVGVLGAVIDFSVYQLALHLGLWVHAARAVSFVCGTTAAYALNRRWAFQVPGGARRAAGYAMLYSSAFFVIMGVNALALTLLPPAWWTVPVAWLLSQGLGTTCNFVLLRTVVFRSPPDRPPPRG
ncbi:MAG: GtrA family protein [Pseudonocardia sp.]|nr:GtrA family protein [Pseudonocardia sp.]